MKRCPGCRRDYYDETLSFCLDDGERLVGGPASDDLGAFPTGIPASESPTRAQINTTDQTAILHRGPEAEPQNNSGGIAEKQNLSANRAAEPQSKRNKLAAIFGIVVLLLIVGSLGYRYFATANSKQIESIAVMPFVNESGNGDAEYLSDGMTETLISSLSQLPNLNVKARSSVFRYKGKDTNAATIGKELNVQAILNGRVVQRGQELVLYVELVDAQTENSLWKQTYNKTMTNLVALQNDIARDVADKLKVKLSGADELKLAKKYTENAEAYQFYLKGRFHLLKTTRSEFETSISYFQQAIAIDPSYALAYAGLADAYRSLSVAGEMPSMEVMPKAKAAVQKAIEIDHTLAEAHAVLGWIIFWYDWDWSAAENQYKRALELDPNNADTHLFYAHLFSNTGRHEEALAEGKRARELDPLNLRTNALEGQFLMHAGRTDEALARLQKTFELDANYWLPHSFMASVYIEKGMYSEAIAEARKAREFSGAATQPTAFFGYALAKSGKEAEARAELERLLKLSTERYVSLYNIAMIYNGLGERDETLAWLERAFQQREPRMVFLKVEPKWNNLRGDPRFQDLMRRVGFPE
ncbi:MAG: tetratricopeptide repeat protein [Pyrinomonadaceae bacterium]